MDLRRERDIEQLRRVALAQQIQIEQLLHVLKLKTKELEAIKGDPAELQQTLALLETLTKQQKAERTVAATSPKKKPKDRKKTGPTAQPRNCAAPSRRRVSKRSKNGSGARPF